MGAHTAALEAVHGLQALLWRQEGPVPLCHASDASTCLLEGGSHQHYGPGTRPELSQLSRGVTRHAFTR